MTASYTETITDLKESETRMTASALKQDQVYAHIRPQTEYIPVLQQIDLSTVHCDVNLFTC